MRSVLTMNQKGQQLNFLISAIIALVVAGIVLVLGLVIQQELRDTQTVGTEAYDAANTTLVGLSTFSDFWEIIVLAIVAAVVVGIVLLSFARKTR